MDCESGCSYHQQDNQIMGGGFRNEKSGVLCCRVIDACTTSISRRRYLMDQIPISQRKIWCSKRRSPTRHRLPLNK